MIILLALGEHTARFPHANCLLNKVLLILLLYIIITL